MVNTTEKAFKPINKLVEQTKKQDVKVSGVEKQKSAQKPKNKKKCKNKQICYESSTESDLECQV